MKKDQFIENLKAANEEMSKMFADGVQEKSDFLKNKALESSNPLYKEAVELACLMANRGRVAYKNLIEANNTIIELSKIINNLIYSGEELNKKLAFLKNENEELSNKLKIIQAKPVEL